MKFLSEAFEKVTFADFGKAFGKIFDVVYFKLTFCNYCNFCGLCRHDKMGKGRLERDNGAEVQNAKNKKSKSDQGNYQKQAH